jgi:hypothetical protein
MGSIVMLPENFEFLHLKGHIRFRYFSFIMAVLLLSLIFEIFNLMLSDWVSFLAYPNLFGIKGFVVVVVSWLYCCSVAQ